MMTVEEAIRHRRSIRTYTDAPVSTVALREMLELALMSPNVGNQQMWRYIAVLDRNLLRMLGGLVERKLDDMARWPEFLDDQSRLRAWRELALHFTRAPAVVFFIGTGYFAPLHKPLVAHGVKLPEVERMLAHSDVQSIAAAAAYFTLAAEARGYGTCWITTPLVARHDLQAALELKSGEEIVALLSVGQPAGAPPPKPRKRIDDVIEWR